MGLKCSLLGHDYGEPEQEAEQERRGGEKVLTVREFRRCTRCGAETVVSENTEVTTVRAAGDVPAESADDDSTPERADSDGPTPTDEADQGFDPSVEDDAIILDDGPEDAKGDGSGGDSVDESDGIVRETDDADGVDTPLADAGADAADGDGDAEATEDDVTDAAESDDADDEDAATVTDAWPVADDVADDEEDAGEPQPWPAVDAEDEGFDAEPGGDAPGVEFGGLTPEGSDLDGQQAGVEESVGSFVGGEADGTDDGGDVAAGTVEGVGITSAGPIERSTDDVDAVLVCPECGFEQGAVATSLRAGDICPEPDCGRGYLTER